MLRKNQFFGGIRKRNTFKNMILTTTALNVSRPSETSRLIFPVIVSNKKSQTKYLTSRLITNKLFKLVRSNT